MTPKKKTAPKKKTVLEGAFQEIPLCVDFDWSPATTLADARWACLIQLDLIESGEDGTEDDDPEAIRRWLKKYGRPQGTGEARR